MIHLHSRRGNVLLLVVLASAFIATMTCAQTIDDIVAQIDETSYQHFLDDVLYTHDGNNRGRNGPDHDPARDNILDEFITDGLDASLHEFQYSYYSGENVIGVQPGVAFPEKMYIICAHYDSVNNPGADDNASGVAGVLEIARVLSQYEFRSTIVYAAWDLEELGLLGSGEWAAEHEQDTIAGVLNMDMIAYNPNERNRGEIFGTEISDTLKFRLADLVEHYAPHIQVSDGGTSGRSDQYSFERRGIPGVWLAEFDFGGNPNYHRDNDSVDTPDYIDYAFATDLVRGTAACAAELAGLVSADDCLLLEMTQLTGGDYTDIRVARGTPGERVVIMWGVDPGQTEVNGGNWCARFGFRIPLLKVTDRVVSTGYFDDNGVFGRRRYVGARFIGREARFQAAMHGTCPDSCMSNVLSTVVQ